MKLTDTQMIVLSSASQRPAYLAMPLPKSLRGGAAKKVVGSLIKAKLIEEVPAQRGEMMWRETGDGHGVTLVITAAGLDAIGVVEPADGAPRPKRGKAKGKAPGAPSAERKPAGAPAEAKPPREGTKQAQMIEMLRRKAGATVDEIAEVTGWQRHTIRGAMAGALKKKMGLNITAEAEERGRVYRIA